jgi:hypothetical protein
VHPQDEQMDNLLIINLQLTQHKVLTRRLEYTMQLEEVLVGLVIKIIR